jgi:hypothetical protein
LKRSAITSESGKTVELPAVITIPDKVDGSVISTVAAGTTVTTGVTSTVTGLSAGAAVGAQADSNIPATSTSIIPNNIFLDIFPPFGFDFDFVSQIEDIKQILTTRQTLDKRLLTGC